MLVVIKLIVAFSVFLQRLYGDTPHDNSQQSNNQINIQLHGELPNYRDASILLIVSTFDGHLSGIKVDLNYNSTNQHFVRFQKMWSVKLFTSHMFKSDMDSSAFYIKGERVVIVPSLQGDLFTIHGSDINIFPYTTDSMLNSNLQFSENITIIGTQTKNIININILNGDVVFRSDSGETTQNESSIYKSREECNIHNDNVPSKDDNIDNLPIVNKITTKQVPISFKVLRRLIKAVNIADGQDKWSYDTIDFTSLDISSCDDVYSQYIKNTMGDEEFHKYKNYHKRNYISTLDDIIEQLRISLADGVICASLPSNTNMAFIYDQSDEKYTNHCVRLNSSLVRAWVVITGGSKCKKPFCMQELNLPEIASSLKFQTQRSSSEDMNEPQTNIFINISPVTCDKSTLGKPTHDTPLPSIDISYKPNAASVHPILYLGKTMDNNQMYVQISDIDMQNMIDQAKRDISNDSSISQGIINKGMFYSALHNAHRNRHANAAHQVVFVVLHYPTLTTLNSKSMSIIPLHSSSLIIYNGNNRAGIFILTNNSGKVYRCKNMEFSQADTVFTFFISITCLIGGILAFLSTNTETLFCSAIPVTQVTEFILSSFEFTLFAFCRFVVYIWKYCKCLIQNSWIMSLFGYRKSNVRHDAVSCTSTKPEFRRWINVKFTSHLLINYQSRYEREYRHIRFLGKGGFGVVFEAINRLDQRRVAVKRINFNNAINTQILQEIRFLAQLVYPHVVYYHCAWFEIPPSDWQKERDKVIIKRHIKDSENISSDSSCSDDCTSRSIQLPVSSDLWPSSLTYKNKESDRNITNTDAQLNQETSNSLQIVFSKISDDDLTLYNEKDNSSEEECSNENYLHTEITNVDSGNSFEVVFESSPGILTNTSNNPISSESEHSNYSKQSDETLAISDTTNNQFTSQGSHTLRSCDRHQENIKKQDHGSKISDHLNQERPAYLYFCMELCQPDTLREWLETHNTNERPIGDAIWYFIQICNGVRYIHACNLIHRDLKPSNILFSVSDNNLVKIGDFGLMTRLNDPLDPIQPEADYANSKDDIHSNSRNTSFAVVGTELYISPEQFQRPPIRLNQSVDIYAMGIILFELLYPFSTKMERILTLRCLRDMCNCQPMPYQVTQEDNLNLLYTDRERSAIIQYQQSHCLEWTLIKWLLSKNPDQRPSADELLNSSIFVELGFKHLDKERFDLTSWRRARCSSSSQT